MKEKMRKFMDEPLTMRRLLKMELIGCGIGMIPGIVMVIYQCIKEKRFEKELEALSNDTTDIVE